MQKFYRALTHEKDGMKDEWNDRIKRFKRIKDATEAKRRAHGIVKRSIA